jgi:hypothetical protein
MDAFRPELFQRPEWGDPLGFTREGKPFWLNRGASEPDQTDDGAQGGTGGDGTAGQGAGTTSGGNTDDDNGDDAQSGDKDSGNAVSREDFEKIQRQLSAADKARQDAQDALKKIEDAKKGDLEKATERADTAEKRVAELEQALQDMRVEQTVLTDPEYGADKWHDPEDILVRVRNAVKDGQVELKDGVPEKTQVQKFLKDTASKKSYLLKTTGGGAAGGKSGSSVGGGDRRNKDGDLTDEDLRKRYRIR